MENFMQSTTFFFSMVWIYIFICAIALWFWIKNKFFKGRKRWFFLSVFLSFLLCVCIDHYLIEIFLIPLPLLTLFFLFIIGKIRHISFNHAEFLAGALLSVPCAMVMLAAWLSIMADIYGV